MAKVNIPNITSGYASVSALNTHFQTIEDELNNKVLYRDNPTGEPNQMENDLDMNGHRILNVIASSGNENFIWKGAWVTGIGYQVNNLVYESGTTYIAIVDHTSGVFSTDLIAGYWEILASQGGSGAGTGDLLAVNNLSELTSTATTARANISAAKSGSNSDITELTALSTPLTVEQGGTGLATLTANNVLVGNGTSNISSVAPGTSGNVLTSNGTSWVSTTLTGAGQIVTTSNAAHTSIATAIPHDDSIPLISEGTEVLSVSITPKAASSKLLIDVTIPLYTTNTGQVVIAALFETISGVSTCIQVAEAAPGGYGYIPLHMHTTVPSNSTTIRTYSVRVGILSGTVSINGGGSRWFGGAQQARITVVEG